MILIPRKKSESYNFSGGLILGIGKEQVVASVSNIIMLEGSIASIQAAARLQRQPFLALPVVAFKFGLQLCVLPPSFVGIKSVVDTTDKCFTNLMSSLIPDEVC